ncbi:MAG: hypothetical protein IPL53_03945 [Ignavibacteria bacterium]|nr:hypothetical protein [Ignavibacteria bacterium]
MRNGKIMVTFSDDFNSPCLGPPVNNKWIGSISKIGGEPYSGISYA